ncbi:hypothetical protein BAU15_02895 [Enterococcus sp. JM4C]|uniref:response regulator n=1 Tax=Candidatus Enterococcus huntleyi TaxID=1857217 RepID=UPI00137A0ACF|nr:response regulator [Enterococcus sp. JM4C]KAF1299608.1 hypothetical protein BAU15_02895 [Enterococcus sp. JM4C]
MYTFKAVVVDDERISADGITKALTNTELPIEITETFYSSEKALDFLKINKIDILITDLKMPKLSGLELIQAALKINQNLQMIVLTGFGSLDYATEAMKYGVRYFLQKPVTKSKLIESLDSAINDSRKSKNSSFLIKRQIVEKMLRDGQIEEQFTGDFSYLMYTAETHAKVGPLVEQQLMSEGVRYIVGGVHEIVIYFFFTKNQVRQTIKKIDFSSISQSFGLFLAENQSLQGMKETFEKGIKFRNLSFYFDQPIVLEINEIREKHEHLKSEFVRKFEQLTKELNENNFSTSYSLLDELFQLAERAYILPDTLKLSLSTLFERLEIKFGTSSEEILKNKHAIESSEQASALKQIIKRSIDDLALSEGGWLSKDNRISDNINLIIEKYYAEHELTLKWISQNFLYLNAEYLGKVYLKESGQKFSNKLQQVRMDYAKQFLLEGRRVYEVAEKVGLGENPDYFSRVFKNYFGMSPKDVKNS